MRIIGILVALVGWIIPILGVVLTQSTAARFALVVLGIAVSLFAIIGILNKAHLKHAIWKL
jgi:hypothetical protein